MLFLCSYASFSTFYHAGNSSSHSFGWPPVLVSFSAWSSVIHSVSFFLSPFSLLLSKAHFCCLSPSHSKQRQAQHQSWSVLWPDTRHILLVFLSVPPRRSDQPSSSCRQRWSRSARNKNLLLLLKPAWHWCFSLLSASKYLRLWMLTPW